MMVAKGDTQASKKEGPDSIGAGKQAGEPSFDIDLSGPA
jgi:hypothetical protein